MTEFGGRTKDPLASDPDQADPGASETAAATAAPADDPVVRRTKDGWRVGGSDLPDLTSAMVLADLISAELTADEAPSSDGAATGRPPRRPISRTGSRPRPRRAGSGRRSDSLSTR